MQACLRNWLSFVKNAAACLIFGKPRASVRECRITSKGLSHLLRSGPYVIGGYCLTSGCGERIESSTFFTSIVTCSALSGES